MYGEIGDGGWGSGLTTSAAGRMLQMCYARSMSMVASRELRNDTAGVLRRAQEGEAITITVNGQPVAVLTAVRPQRRRWLTRPELLQRLKHQADPGLRDDLADLAGESTDDLEPLR
jgi:prevent-host-death family protein